MDTRPIPSTGEPLPVIGCGTWQAFDVAPDGAGVATLTSVVRTLLDAGGSMIDSSPMYGRAEAVVGKCLTAPGMRERAFVATKVWTRGRQAGIEEMRRSLALLGTPRLDLMQIHNLLDWRTHLATLRDWKAEGTIRYLGVTHYTASAHAELAAVLRSEPLDFVQVNYSLEEPEAARELLPLAADRGIAVIVNRPFGGGALVRRLRTQRGCPSGRPNTAVARGRSCCSNTSSRIRRSPASSPERAIPITWRKTAPRGPRPSSIAKRLDGLFVTVASASRGRMPMLRRSSRSHDASLGVSVHAQRRSSSSRRPRPSAQQARRRHAAAAVRPAPAPAQAAAASGDADRSRSRARSLRQQGSRRPCPRLQLQARHRREGGDRRAVRQGQPGRDGLHGR